MNTWELAEIMYSDRLESQAQEEDGMDEDEEAIRREVSEGRVVSGRRKLAKAYKYILGGSACSRMIEVGVISVHVPT